MNALWLLAAKSNQQGLNVSASVCPDLLPGCHGHLGSRPTNYEDF